MPPVGASGLGSDSDSYRFCGSLPPTWCTAYTSASSFPDPFHCRTPGTNATSIPISTSSTLLDLASLLVALPDLNALPQFEASLGKPGRALRDIAAQLCPPRATACTWTDFTTSESRVVNQLFAGPREGTAPQISGSIRSLRGYLSRRGATEPGAVPHDPVGAVIEERPWSAPCARPEPRPRVERSARRGRLVEAADHSGSLRLLRQSGAPDEEDRWRPRIAAGAEAAAVSCATLWDAPAPDPHIGVAGVARLTPGAVEADAGAPVLGR
ncbi:hypothetical protein NDU88_000719 [Pleurodeles waltl]|uniref:Uncharacterized protein n=1 Tax=Pleurodeles waltl TaxID=8319 RepID=A0AAV7VZB8_PLEWA|nr:hypothetical protein NDU88_000719 [Pleurodeles waltl]